MRIKGGIGGNRRLSSRQSSQRIVGNFYCKRERYANRILRMAVCRMILTGMGQHKEEDLARWRGLAGCCCFPGTHATRITAIAGNVQGVLSSVAAFRRLAQFPSIQCSILVVFTVLLRLTSASGPYYVDAPRHISAIESGLLVIQPPGYFLFNATGLLLCHLLHVSAGTALQILNITFSVSGVAVFYLLLSRLPTISSPFWLSLAYACSPIVWFSGDIHSSYAAMTLFAPLLILVLECERRFLWGCVIWALMTGFRPSDGVFVLPWVAFHSPHYAKPDINARMHRSLRRWWWTLEYLPQHDPHPHRGWMLPPRGRYRHIPEHSYIHASVVKRKHLPHNLPERYYLEPEVAYQTILPS
jgi:hypothetical protein